MFSETSKLSNNCSAAKIISLLGKIKNLDLAFNVCLFHSLRAIKQNIISVLNYILKNDDYRSKLTISVKFSLQSKCNNIVSEMHI